MTTRRNFVKNVAVGSAAVAVGGTAYGLSPRNYRRVMGANDRLNIAMIGTHSRGFYLTDVFMKSPDTDVIYICDVDSRVVKKTVKKVADYSGQNPKFHKDMRKMLEDKDIDAVVIATPDNWHAPAAILALRAGKHVYVEKPCCYNPDEGEMLVAAQKKYAKIVQMGNQQRSSVETMEVIRGIREGIIGEVYKAYTWYANHRGSIGHGKEAPVPAWLDWDLWQGPAPRKAYHDNYVHYNWHWFWHWGTAETGNNATHELDIARWALNVEFPEKTSVFGKRYFYTDDDWEMYDTLNATFFFNGGKTITWDGESCNSLSKWGRGRGTAIYGTKGSYVIDRSGYELYDLAGKLVKKVTPATRNETINIVGGGNLGERHVHNFLDTIRGKTRKQNSPIDEGYKSTLLVHLANIAYRTGKTIHSDPVNGHIKEPEGMKLWSREYEPGWKPVV